MKFSTANAAILSLLTSTEPSRWSKRTSKRRARTDRILRQIRLPPNTQWFGEHFGDQFAVPVLDAPAVDWDLVDYTFDPQQGGKLQANTPRAQRKRIQVEAFAYVLNQILDQSNGQTIVDAGSGAGNLCIPLAGLLDNVDEICGIDVNPLALDRLMARARDVCQTRRVPLASSRPLITTIHSDLALTTLPERTTIVLSLHGCGAATDMAIRLATNNNLPFVVSPCCTAKAVTARVPQQYGPSASVERSGAPSDIRYPRSQWLRASLNKLNLNSNHVSTPEEFYELLAKTADVGLGPQTPTEQRNHQRMAKIIVELDRLQHAKESHEYQVRLVRLRGHDDYGKSELLIGAPAASEAARAMSKLMTTCAI